MNYRESISKVSQVKYTHKKQSGGQGQFAEIEVRFEPLEAGSGYEFKSEIKGGSVPREYVPGVVKGLEECMSNGVLAGYPVVDVRAVLMDGSYHEVDSSVLAFQLAARGAFREGINKAGPRLLEPIMKVRFFLCAFSRCLDQKETTICCFVFSYCLFRRAESLN